MADKINHPDYYNNNGIECIECICAALGDDGAAEFCIGNALKYIYRHKYKGTPVFDIKKAIWYLNKWLTLTEFINHDVSREISGCPFDESDDT